MLRIEIEIYSPSTLVKASSRFTSSGSLSMSACLYLIPEIIKVSPTTRASCFLSLARSASARSSILCSRCSSSRRSFIQTFSQFGFDLMLNLALKTRSRVSRQSNSTTTGLGLQLFRSGGPVCIPYALCFFLS